MFPKKYRGVIITVTNLVRYQLYLFHVVEYFSSRIFPLYGIIVILGEHHHAVYRLQIHLHYVVESVYGVFRLVVGNPTGEVVYGEYRSHV